MSLTNSDTSIINSNPINNLIGVRTRAWTCKHKGITILDEQNWIYKCHVCWPCGGDIRVIPRTPKMDPEGQGQGQVQANYLRVYKNPSMIRGGDENVFMTELVLDLSAKPAAK